jgi:hypothetical protein
MPKNETPQNGFDNLLLKLVQVPKEEIDSEEAKWKAIRGRLKAKGEASGAKLRKLPPKTGE